MEKLEEKIEYVPIQYPEEEPQEVIARLKRIEYDIESLKTYRESLKTLRYEQE